jgi:hypothetical protein
LVSDLQVRFDCRFQLTLRGDPGLPASAALVQQTHLSNSGGTISLGIDSTW